MPKIGIAALSGYCRAAIWILRWAQSHRLCPGRPSFPQVSDLEIVYSYFNNLVGGIHYNTVLLYKFLEEMFFSIGVSKRSIVCLLKLKRIRINYIPKKLCTKNI